MGVVIVVIITGTIEYGGTGGTVAYSAEVASSIVVMAAVMVVVEVTTVPAVQHAKV